MKASDIAGVAADVRQRIREGLDSDFVVDGECHFEHGLGALEFGDVVLASRFFAGAAPMLGTQLSLRIPIDVSEHIDGVPPNQRPLIDRLTRSEWHGYLALCHWLLENRHDEESYRLVAEEMDRFLVQKEDEAVSRSSAWREWFCRQFIAARDYRRLLKWMPDAPSLKKHQSGPMKMAWLLARHHVHGESTRAELDHAWTRFLDKAVPQWIEQNRLLDLAVWMKVRYWDDVEPKPDPYDAFLRFWDHLPGIERPPVVR